MTRTVVLVPAPMTVPILPTRSRIPRLLARLVSEVLTWEG